LADCEFRPLADYKQDKIDYTISKSCTNQGLLKQETVMNRTSVYKRIVGLIIRFVLFSLVLGLGTLAALVVDEQSGLAATTLPDASVQTVASKDDVLYVNVVVEDPRSGADRDEAQQTSGLYRSQDHGRSWQYVGSGPGVPIKALAIHPVDKNVLYAGTEGGASVNANNIWTSGNGGQNWHRFYLKLPSTAAGLIPDVTALAVDPKQPDELYVGTAGQGVYRYQAAPDGYGYELVGGLSSPSGYVKGLVVSPDSRVYALTTESLMVIDGDGDIWHKVETLPDLAVSLAIDPTNPQILYAGTVAYGAYRSTDGGQTWQAINEGLGWQPGILLRVSAISVDEANAQHLVLATAYSVGSQLAGEGIYESLAAGQSWVKVADTQAVVDRLIVDASGIYAATANGLVRYGDPVSPAPTTSLTGLRDLTRPSGVQMLILSLTLILAGLILVGRVEWISNRQFAHSLVRK
jgi:photosystem II stability/assembly factor-like uncharacterized protein